MIIVPTAVVCCPIIFSSKNYIHSTDRRQQPATSLFDCIASGTKRSSCEKSRRLLGTSSRILCNNRTPFSFFCCCRVCSEYPKKIVLSLSPPFSCSTRIRLALVDWILSYNEAMESLQDRHVGLDRLCSQIVDNVIQLFLDPPVKLLLSSMNPAPIVKVCHVLMIQSTLTP